MSPFRQRNAVFFDTRDRPFAMMSNMIDQQSVDEKYMRRCLQLAVCGRDGARPNPMVGAVIVADGRIIGEGYHIRCGEAHAEVNAFASVQPDDDHLLSSATLYVSLEPCSHYGKTPPCADLIVRKKVRRVVVGCIDSYAEVQGRGVQKLREAGIDVTVGVLERECRWLNRRFFTFHREHRPYIILKWAQTADGFLDCCGEPIAISTSFTQMLVHQLRATCDAILVGRVTDEREHPRLDVRHWNGRSPVRFVLSHQHPIEEILNTCHERKLQSLLVEGGRATLQSFLDAGLWDEVRVETGTMAAGKGTVAPLLPAEAELVTEKTYDGNTVRTYSSSRLSQR